MVLSNFRKFRTGTFDFVAGMNVLIGDNEAGKSTVLLALDLALSGSRSKVETIGIESLFCKKAVDEFLKGNRQFAELPVLAVEVFLSDVPGWELHGRANSEHRDAFGLRLTCEPSEDYRDDIAQVLSQPEENFPFEFYTVKFTTFAGQPYGGRRHVEHLLIDSSQINTEYAHREYTKRLYQAHATTRQRATQENLYRLTKQTFWTEHLKDLNEKIEVKFWLRSSSKSNLESDLVIVKDGMPIENKGRGQQSLIKTAFALHRSEGKRGIDILLLEEPENHLSHVTMHALVQDIASTRDRQIFVTTHSSLICSRLDLRNAILLDQDGKPARLTNLDQETSDFFCKAPDHNVLEFAMSSRVLLVEGDAEYILASALYSKATGSSLAKDKVHVIAVGGTSFKRYLELAKTLNIRTAVVRDNDGDYEKNCVDSYVDYVGPNVKIFSDLDSGRSTFEICMYQDNSAACEELFAPGRRKLTVLEFMLDNKAEVALKLLERKADSLVVPSYLCEAMAWIRE